MLCWAVPLTTFQGLGMLRGEQCKVDETGLSEPQLSLPASLSLQLLVAVTLSCKRSFLGARIRESVRSRSYTCPPQARWPVLLWVVCPRQLQMGV